MREWFWKVVEVIAVVLFVVIILLPWSMLGDFFSDLYDANPVYCISLLTAIGALFVATVVHAETERRRKTANKDKAASSGGAL